MGTDPRGQAAQLVTTSSRKDENKYWFRLAVLFMLFCRSMEHVTIMLAAAQSFAAVHYQCVWPHLRAPAPRLALKGTLACFASVLTLKTIARDCNALASARATSGAQGDAHVLGFCS